MSATRPGTIPQLARRAAAEEKAPEISLTVDGEQISVPQGATLLDACRSMGKEIPTLCFHDTLHPVNACRMCVVEVEGARVLAPSCARAAEPGMVVHTQSERVRNSRKIVLELLASTVDLSTTPKVAEWMREYGCDVERYGPPAEPVPSEVRDHRHPGHHHPPDASARATVAQEVKVDNDLYVRDYSKCILCYKCVEACGPDHQNTFAIAVSGRGFDARISTEFGAALPDSACVYCGNCVQVCPTGALMFKSEHDMRAAGTWDESRQTTTDTICSYCGVGCTLRLQVQDGVIVKALSPEDNPVTMGNLCVKGRFGWKFVNGTDGE